MSLYTNSISLSGFFEVRPLRLIIWWTSVNGLSPVKGDSSIIPDFSSLIHVEKLTFRGTVNSLKCRLFHIKTDPLGVSTFYDLGSGPACVTVAGIQ